MKLKCYKAKQADAYNSRRNSIEQSNNFGDFVEELKTEGTAVIHESKLRMGIGIKPISDGVVIDHISQGSVQRLKIQK